MPEHGKNFDEVVSETAKRKKRAAEVHLSGKAPSEADPREVYLAGCGTIADAIRADGYSYIKSGAKLRRKSQDFTFQISFQSSHNNISGELVALWIHVYVFSPTLKQWRISNHCLVNKSDFVAGGQIGNLISPFSWMEWNLAVPNRRDSQIADAVSTIRRIAAPYFSMFDAIPALINRLTNEEVPSFSPASALDFLMCFGSRAEARKAAENMLQRLPGARDRYPTALTQYRANGLPSYAPTAHGEVLSAATIVFDFPDLSH